MTGIVRMDHFTVVTDRLADTQRFYEALGLSAGPRPEFGIGGCWLYAGAQPVLHLVETAKMPAIRRGAIDHIAFAGGEINTTLQGLVERGIAYRLIRLPRPWSSWQVFFDDPNGVEVEIDFDAEQKVLSHLKPAAIRDPA